MTEDKKITGAEAVIEALVENGVEVIFGYPGGAVPPLYDAIFDNKNIKHVLVRHEQAAVHAAKYRPPTRYSTTAYVLCQYFAFGTYAPHYTLAGCRSQRN